jgi:hypothetical protein
VNAGFVVNCIFDVFFILDIILNFRTGFYFHGKVIMDPPECSKHYFKNSFKYDAIASIPVDYFAFNAGGGSTLTKAPKFARVLRIFR